MSAIASGWNVIYRKKTLEDNAYNLRRVMLAPETGPFKHVRRIENEIWVLEKKKDHGGAWGVMNGASNGSCGARGLPWRGGGRVGSRRVRRPGLAARGGR